LVSRHEYFTFRGGRVGTEDVPTLVYCTTTKTKENPPPDPRRAVPRERGIVKGERESTRWWIKRIDVNE
jgi:hypothetical protein